jgi:hypothetical protein
MASGTRNIDDQMYKSGGKAIHNRDGKLVKAAPYQASATSGAVSRIEPNRRWFGNTRVISQQVSILIFPPPCGLCSLSVFIYSSLLSTPMVHGFKEHHDRSGVLELLMKLISGTQ